MKKLLAVCGLAFSISCKSPNDAASTRVSTAPMSNDPDITMPGTGANRPYTPASQRDSAHVLSTDSSQGVRLDTVPQR